jgi:hypothetical protein
MPWNLLIEAVTAAPVGGIVMPSYASFMACIFERICSAVRTRPRSRKRSFDPDRYTLAQASSSSAVSSSLQMHFDGSNSDAVCGVAGVLGV